MKVLFLLTFFINTNHMLKRQEPYAYYHKNFSTYAFHTYAFEYGGNHQRSFTPEESISRNYARSFPIQEHDDEETKGLHVRPREAQPARIEQRSDAITYPQQYKLQTRNSQLNDTGYNCLFDLCEEVSNYPTDYVRGLFNRTRAFDSFFKNVQFDVGSRLPGTENLCSSKFNTTFPKIAMNTQKKKRYIANIDQYQQGIKIETCNEEGGQCKFSEFWPLNYESVCEQRFTITPLLALDDEMNPIVDTFQTPSCCVCLYRPA